MWRNKDYNELQTFGEWATEHDFQALFAGSQIDAATQQNILSWFFTRKVFTADVDDFIRKFKIKLFTVESQYLQYIRVESTQFDPMVQNYMERLVTGTTTASTTTDVATKGGITTTTDTETEEEVKANRDSNSTTTTADEAVGTVNETREGSNTTVFLGNTDTDRKADTINTLAYTKNVSTDGTNKGLTGQLPRSTTYGNGLPTTLNWALTSTQEEGRTDSSEDTTGRDTNTIDATEKTELTTNDRTTLTIDETINRASTDDKTGRSTTKADETSDQNKDGKVHSVATTENNGTSATTGESTGEAETKERYSGRSQAPQDMLDRARNYILKTNAFTWLTTQLESVFMSVYEW